jgi:DNA topoisomerase-1
MRTDSVNLSQTALGMAREVISDLYGDDYIKIRTYANKVKGAQEAHEAIRPTNLSRQTIDGSNDVTRLYSLIWKRTVASQMSDAILEKTAVIVSSSAAPEHFAANGEVVKFDGFLKVYMEGSDEENGDTPGLLPAMKPGEDLLLIEMRARQRFTKALPRYTEASLVKKLEELGIGRPSTYAPTISTIQKREYIVKESRPSATRDIQLITLKNGHVSAKSLAEKIDTEKAKLFPTDIGTLVNNFLLKYFDDILDYSFTANVEKEFDEIAIGKKKWNTMIKEFYGPFHNKIESTLENSGRFTGERLLGQDPKTGLNLFVKIGRYGPMAQIGDTDSEDKPKFSGLRKDQSIETITLEEALKLFDFPRSLGEFEGKEVTAAIGRFGPYVKHNNKFVSLKKEDDAASIDLARAIELIEEKRIVEQKKIIKEFAEDEDVRVLKGRFGPYLVIKKQNYKIPKGTEPETLSLEDCYKIAKDPNNLPKKRFARKKK